MDNFLTWIKVVFGAVLALLSYLFGGLDVLLSALLVCMATDYVTGVFAAIYEKRLNSQTGFRGILKKLVMLFLVVLTHMLETAAG
ncbi:MAG: phage holin family protein, partial [Clostridia bacterium]|nr:phage holin family protein [Clostridia bacterium]